MGKRSDEFIAKLEATNTGKVYFQPPDGSRLTYPCWVIERQTAYQPNANDHKYLFRPGYKVMYINQNEPDPEEIMKMLFSLFPHTNYQQHYAADNLHHDVFTIYY